MYTAMKKDKINQAIKQRIELDQSDSKPTPTPNGSNEDSFYFPTLNQANKDELPSQKKKVNVVKRRENEQVLRADSDKNIKPNYQSFCFENWRKPHKQENIKGRNKNKNMQKPGSTDKGQSKMDYYSKLQQFKEILKPTLFLIDNKKQIFGFKVDEETQLLRQKFMRKITEVLEHMETSQQEFFIKNIGKTMKVYPFEIKLWLIAYSIAEKVKKFEEYCQVNNKQIKKMDRLAVIRIQMMSYLKKNIHEKRYRILKILKRVFDTLGLTAFKITQWYDEMILENKDQLLALGFEDKTIAMPTKVQLMGYWDHLKEEVNQPASIEEPVYKSSNNSSNPNETSTENNFRSISSLFNSRMSSKSKIMETKKIQKDRMSNAFEIFTEPKEFPEDFKKRISAKIDRAIDDFVRKLFKEKANEVCVSQETLMAIYQIYGKKSQSFVKQQSQYKVKHELDKREKSEESSITDSYALKQ